ncbi:MAG: phosphotransferase [Caldilineaceae bacterium]
MDAATPARVLVVENDGRISQYLATILTKRGYEVHVAQGFGDELVESARALGKRVRPHVAIVDLRLTDDYTDDRSGLELLPDLKSARCILYSAYLAPDILRQARRTEQAVDWVDKQNIELLYSAVDEAAQQTCAGVRGVAVQWPPGWSVEHLTTTIFKDADTMPAATILDDVVFQLFSANERIVPEAVTGAVGGVQSVLRGRSLVAKIHPDALQPKVLKLGNAARTQREHESYLAYVHDQLPGLYHTQIEKHITFWDLGGTVYSFVGADQQVLPTFTLHYAQHDDSAAILSPLYHLFTTVWLPHYERSQPAAFDSLFAAYDAVFNFANKYARIEEELVADLMAILTRPLPNPIAWVREWGRHSTIPSARQAVTHGDLHGDNLFVEGGRAWIIDFERTGPGHALRDFAELEVDIFARLIDQGVSWPDLQQLALLLAEPQKPGAIFQTGAMLHDQHDIQKAIAVIGGIRQMAHTTVRYSDQREYLWAMLFDAIFVASVQSMNKTQRLRALLYAGALCKRLQTWGEEWVVENGK